MPRRPATVKSVDQRILRRIHILNIPLSPSEVKNSFTSNIFHKTLSILIGETEAGDFIPLKATNTGILRVQAALGGYTSYKVHSGTAPDAYSSTHTYVEDFTHVSILVEDNDAKISMRDQNGVWGNDIPLTVGWHAFDFNGSGIRIKNRVSGSNAKYTIILWR